MTRKEMELMAMLISIHRKIDSLHEESNVDNEMFIGYINSKLSFSLTATDLEQLRKYLAKHGPQSNRKHLKKLDGRLDQSIEVNDL